MGGKCNLRPNQSQEGNQIEETPFKDRAQQEVCAAEWYEPGEQGYSFL